MVTTPSGKIELVHPLLTDDILASIDSLTDGDTIRGPGNVFVRAFGSTADVQTGGQSANTSIRGLGNGTVTVIAAGVVHAEVVVDGETGFLVPPGDAAALAEKINATHRDSLGFEQAILPGEVNWMTAGRGITHSERFETIRAHGGVLQDRKSVV